MDSLASEELNVPMIVEQILIEKERNKSGAEPQKGKPLVHNSATTDEERASLFWDSIQNYASPTDTSLVLVDLSFPPGSPRRYLTHTQRSIVYTSEMYQKLILSDSKDIPLILSSVLSSDISSSLFYLFFSSLLSPTSLILVDECTYADSPQLLWRLASEKKVNVVFGTKEMFRRSSESLNDELLEVNMIAFLISSVLKSFPGDRFVEYCTVCFSF